MPLSFYSDNIPFLPLPVNIISFDEIVEYLQCLYGIYTK